MNLENRAEELASDLDADKGALEQDLENLLSYSVPLEEAIESLRRKYGDTEDGDRTPRQIDVADITPESGSVTVTVTVLTAGRRRINYQGSDQEIWEGEVADETGRISYTAWTDFDPDPGAVITISNAGVREWEGYPELNIGEQTIIESADVAMDPVGEIGGESDLADLDVGDRGRTVTVRILEVEDRTIEGRSGDTEILSGGIGDPTARLPFTDWDPHDEIVEGASVRLENVYVREFRGVPSVNITEYTDVVSLDETISTGEPTRLRIRSAISRGGLYDVEVRGNVVDIRDGSGLVSRCPECGRVLQKGQCRTHGEVEGVDDLRVKAVVDDGTESITAILDAELTRSVYGGSLEDAREEAREAMDQDVVAERIADRLLGKEYCVRGHLSVDEFGANLEVRAFNPVDEEAGERAREFVREVAQ